jgi:hypothetical protein
MLELYNDQQLFDINAVLMHLKVMTFSDIVNANGQIITEEAYNWQKLSNRYSRLKWLRQLVITMKQQKLWKAALEAAFMSSEMVLKQPLGKWTGPLTQVWRSFYNPGTKRIVTSMIDGDMTQFTEYTVHQQTHHQVTSMYVSLYEVNWNIMIPANVKKNQTQHVIATFHLHLESNQDPEDWNQWVSQPLKGNSFLWMVADWEPDGSDLGGSAC